MEVSTTGEDDVGKDKAVLYESILKKEGMPANLKIGEHVDIEEIEPGTSLCDALHDALAEVGTTPEDFLMAAVHDPEGLRIWIESWAGPLN